MGALDNSGVAYLWQKIKSFVASAISGKLDTTGNAYRALSIPFGKVDSTSTSTAFTASIPGITELRDGVCVYLKNSVVTSASGFTININSLGAKPVYQTMAAATAVTTLFNKNYTMLFVYNSTRVSGGCWDMFYGYNANTTYSNASLGQGYATCDTAAATAAKAATLASYALTAGGYVGVKFTYAVPAGATLNVNSKGAKAIYYKGSAITSGIIQAGDLAVFLYNGSQYHLVGIDRWGDELADLKSRLTYSVTNVLTGCSTSSAVTSLMHKDAYTATITPDSGKSITDIRITMGGIDITDSVWTGVEA